MKFTLSFFLSMVCKNELKKKRWRAREVKDVYVRPVSKVHLLPRIETHGLLVAASASLPPTSQK